MKVYTNLYNLTIQLLWFNFVCTFVNKIFWNVLVQLFCQILYVNHIIDLKTKLYIPNILCLIEIIILSSSKERPVNTKCNLK